VILTVVLPLSAGDAPASVGSSPCVFVDRDDAEVDGPNDRRTGCVHPMPCGHVGRRRDVGAVSEDLEHPTAQADEFDISLAKF
jgi:hypothetical protein